MAEVGGTVAGVPSEATVVEAPAVSGPSAITAGTGTAGSAAWVIFPPAPNSTMLRAHSLHATR